MSKTPITYEHVGIAVLLTLLIAVLAGGVIFWIEMIDAPSFEITCENGESQFIYAMTQQEVDGVCAISNLMLPTFLLSSTTPFHGELNRK